MLYQKVLFCIVLQETSSLFLFCFVLFIEVFTTTLADQSVFPGLGENPCVLKLSCMKPFVIPQGALQSL